MSSDLKGKRVEKRKKKGRRNLKMPNRRNRKPVGTPPPKEGTSERINKNQQKSQKNRDKITEAKKRKALLEQPAPDSQQPAPNFQPAEAARRVILEAAMAEAKVQEAEEKRARAQAEQEGREEKQERKPEIQPAGPQPAGQWNRSRRRRSGRGGGEFKPLSDLMRATQQRIGQVTRDGAESLLKSMVEGETKWDTKAATKCLGEVQSGSAWQVALHCAMKHSQMNLGQAAKLVSVAWYDATEKAQTEEEKMIAGFVAAGDLAKYLYDNKAFDDTANLISYDGSASRAREEARQKALDEMPATRTYLEEFRKRAARG